MWENSGTGVVGDCVINAEDIIVVVRWRQKDRKTDLGSIGIQQGQQTQTHFVQREMIIDIFCFQKSPNDLELPISYWINN